jgi:YHS domain-containing protein
MVLFPVLSFMTGKLESFKIKNNIECQYTTTILPDKTLKFIGKAGSIYFFSSLDNIEKFIVHDDKFDIITLKNDK